MKTTGRKFRCIGLKENEIESWAISFTIGYIYPEMVHGRFSQGGDDGTLYLDSNTNNGFWVDASQFELVEEC